MYLQLFFILNLVWMAAVIATGVFCFAVTGEMVSRRDFWPAMGLTYVGLLIAAAIVSAFVEIVL